MANLSDAWGNIYLSEFKDIHGNPCHDYEKFWQALNDAQGNWEYGFYCNLDAEDEVTFNGTGRWTFEVNMENMPRWLSESSEDEEVKQAQQFLESTSWRLDFDFQDVEPGWCKVAYESKWTMTHIAGTKIDTSKVELMYHLDYDLSLWTLVYQFSMDWDYALEYVVGTCVEEMEIDEVQEQLDEIKLLNFDESSCENTIKNNLILSLENLIKEKAVE